MWAPRGRTGLQPCFCSIEKKQRTERVIWIGVERIIASNDTRDTGQNPQAEYGTGEDVADVGGDESPAGIAEPLFRIEDSLVENDEGDAREGECGMVDETVGITDLDILFNLLCA